MNKRTRKVFEMLKPKVKALGFSRKELESVAEDLSDNLDLDDEASEEDEKAEIEKSVNAVVPFLKLSQKAASRAIDNYKKQLEDKDDDNDDDDDDNDDVTPVQKNKKDKSGKSGKSSNDAEDETAKLLKQMMSRFDAIDDKIASMEKGKTADSRRAKLEKLVKDTGSFGKRTLRNFDKMSFESDDDFEEFIDEVEADLKEINEERTQKGLEALGKPIATGKGGGEESSEEKPMTDNEIDGLADFVS